MFLLWLSFRKQLKKIDFEEEPDTPADSSADPPADSDDDSPADPDGSAQPPERPEP